MSNQSINQFFTSESGRIIQGHVLEVLRGLPENSVDCVVTSPPYWGLRDYKIEPQVWDENHGPCEHEWGEESRIQSTPQTGLPYAGAHSPEAMKECLKKRSFDASQGSFCLRCGAWRGSLGLEPTPELFCQHIVQVFREVRRVLKPSGVCFVNLGDSFASGKGSCFNPGGGSSSLGQDRKTEGVHPLNRGNKSTLEVSGLKPKDLCGIPWRVAFALQADGWWLRSDIIWAKPNPMPESVTDRPTKSHEYIFLLTKSAKYFWNQAAVREPHELSSIQRSKYPVIGDPRAWREENAGLGPQGHVTAWNYNPLGRNIRSVWTFATEHTPEAHFATFPQELVRRCILAGTSERGCCSAMIKKLKLRDDLTIEERIKVTEYITRKGLA
jgi:DNA modification methylase